MLKVRGWFGNSPNVHGDTVISSPHEAKGLERDALSDLAEILA